MIADPFAKFDFSKPFETKKSRNLFGYHTTPREFKHGARDIPFGMGAKSLYVDGTNGDDSNDGESWITAKATIQEAIDTAESWTQIFIKSATYAENVVIPTGKDSIGLFGEKESGVTVIPASGRGIDVAADRCEIHNLTAIGNGSGSAGPGVFFSRTAAVNPTATNLTIGNQHATGTGLMSYGEYATIEQIKCSTTHQPYDALYIYSSKYTTVYDCHLDAAHIGIYVVSSDDCKVHNNTILNGSSRGMYVYGGSYNTIYHNNFINNTTQLSDNEATAIVFENFYDDHTNVDNGHGIATEPYAFTGGSDLRPVAIYNGWNSVSILRTLLRKRTAAQTTQAATDANGTAWVDLKTLAPSTTDIELYRINLTTAGAWAGTAMYRIIIGSSKVYSFPDDQAINSGTLETFIFPINVQINETAKIQFRSTNAADGAGETVALTQLDYTTVL